MKILSPKSFALIFLFLMVVKMNGQGRNESLKISYAKNVLYTDPNAFFAQQTHPNEVTLELKNFNLTNWKITVRATSDFLINGGAEAISPANFSLGYNSGPINSGPPVSAPLGTGEVEIFSSTAVLQNTQTVSFDWITHAGATDLLNSSNGIFSGSLEFLIYDMDTPGMPLVARSSGYSFQKKFPGNVGNNSLSLSMEAISVYFDYSGSGDLTIDKVVTLSSGMSVTYNKAYQVLVKASSDFFAGANFNDQIPVSIMTLDAVPVTATGITVNPVVPTLVDQPFIESTGSSSGLDFELSYTIPKGSLSGDFQPDTYTTHLTFTIVEP